LARLTDEQAAALLTKLQQSGPVLFRGDVGPFVPEDVPGLSAEDAVELMTALLGAGSYHSSSGDSTDRFAADVASSSDLKLEPDERSALKSRLTALLSVPSVAASTKALDLQSEHERLFHSARILTDLRPVFGNEEVTSPTATLITHMLKLEYHEESGHEALYVALDDGDIEQLIQVLMRAQQKSQSLRSLVAASGLTLLWPAPDTAKPLIGSTTSNG
jgi:hypothetical protein